MTTPQDDTARRATDEARRAQETLKDAQSCLGDAIDQMGRTVAGSRHRLPAAAVERCVGALTLTHQMSTLIDGIAADARRRTQASLLPDVVVPLHEALGRVHQCASSVRALRLAAERTERRVRRGAGDDPLLTSVAARWGVAARRLDGLAARLEAGARALDAYLDGVVCGTDHGAVRRTRLAAVVPAVWEPDTVAEANAARVVRLVALAEPDRGRQRGNTAPGELWNRPWRR